MQPYTTKFSQIAILLLLTLGFTQTMSADIRTFTVNGVSFNMVTVEGGTFIMGDGFKENILDASPTHHDASPTHSVTLSSFLIGQTEVTQELWQAVMGNNPSYWFWRDRGDKYPVQQVSWYDCQEFITKLNAMTGEKFRLPTEAEWEYAARGGNKTNHYKYAGSNNLKNVAWYYGTLQKETFTNPHYMREVGTKQPNELGLYDMSGNVWEWCQDWHGAYEEAAQTNPTGPSTGIGRICRGGGWNSNDDMLRVSHRRTVPQRHKNNDLGLRLAL
jgi:formylglycine-generating enzyme required for sulfatase activity